MLRNPFKELDANIRKSMAVNGKKRVKAYYTHEISMSKYRKLYQEVL